MKKFCTCGRACAMGKTGIYKDRCWECWEKHERLIKQTSTTNRKRKQAALKDESMIRLGEATSAVLEKLEKQLVSHHVDK